MSRGTAATLEKLAKSVAEGDHYEAQQMYKTLYHRALSRKNYKKVEELLIGGIKTMGEHDQGACALELGELLIEYLDNPKANVEVDQRLELLGKAMDLFPESEHCIKFMNKALGHTSRVSGVTPTHLVPLHAQLAKRAQQQRNWAQALLHYANAGDVVGLLETVRASWEGAPVSERDLFIARVTLFLLAMAKEEVALRVFTPLYAELDEETKKTPTILFTRILLEGCTKLDAAQRQPHVFEDIIQSFDPLNVFERDSIFEDLLVSIGSTYFDFVPASGSTPNFLNMLMEMMGGMSEQTTEA